jgi:hypothetical protein
MTLLRIARLMAILAPAALEACSGPIVESVQPMARLTASPADGTTGLAALDVGLSISAGSFFASDLDAIGRGTQLFTWPALTPISTVAMPVAAPDAGGTGFPVSDDVGIRLTPTAPVADGWYVAILGGVPSRVTLSPAATHILDDGRRSVRVHVGAAPALWAIGACPKEGGVTAVVVRVSEPVHVVGTTFPISVSAGAPAAPSPCAAPSTPPGGSITDFEFLCSSMSTTSSIDVVVGDGLVSRSGVPVATSRRSAPLSDYTFDIFSNCPSLKIDP